MNKIGTDSAAGPASPPQWTLIRGARQLLTLRGSSGPRRGSAMSDLSVIPDGAVLIRDGIIEEIGTTRRVENLVPARLAREYDASGQVVMPAFVDPDIAIAAPASGGNTEDDDPREADIRRMSRRRLENQAGITAADLARYGVLTIGAHTLWAPDLQNTLKALRLHQAMQLKPLRISSIFAPPWEAGAIRYPTAANLSALLDLNDAGPTDMSGLWGLQDTRTTDIGKLRALTDARAEIGERSGDEDSNHRRRVRETWMPAVFRKKLASLVEIAAASGQIGDAREMASAAAAVGFHIRFRVTGPSTADILELAYSAGAVALIGPIPGNSGITRALADVGCVHVTLATGILSGNSTSKRSAIDDGTPLALASGYQRDGNASMNPQYMLFAACQSLGLTIEEAIIATTYNAACSLRLSHLTGSLEIGKLADICVMDVDDYHELARRAGHHDVSLVMRAGKIVYRRPNLTLD